MATCPSLVSLPCHRWGEGEGESESSQNSEEKCPNLKKKKILEKRKDCTYQFQRTNYENKEKKEFKE